MENKSSGLGVLFILCSALCFAASSLFGKLVTVNSNLSGAMASFSRFFLGTLIMLIFMILTKKSFKANKMKYIAIRSISNGLSILLFSIGFQLTSITNANMLQMTYPVFVMIIAPVFFNEKFSKKSYILLLFIMFGCYLVVNPDFSSINYGDVFSLVSSLAAAFSVLALKEARKYDDTYIILFYVFAIAIFVNFPFALKDFKKLNFEPSIIFFIVSSGLMGFFGQILITEGYKYVDNATGAMVSTFRIIIAALMGIIIFNDPINLRILIGGLIVMLSLVEISGYFDIIKKKTKSKN